ncbi:MAG: GntR family transcriptional regulator [Phycisphaeraceae bacterium]|nr:GntR family transcriptional regulator [Phycisphaeraceae bacterium]
MALRFHILPTSGVPIYRQVMEQVRAAVAGGHLREGDFLPSVREVAAELAVNPMTISKAYSLLERDGVVQMVRGQGMRVAARRAVGTLRQRREALRPLLAQVAAAAYQLSLSGPEVAQMLEALMKETDRE